MTAFRIIEGMAGATTVDGDYHRAAYYLDNISQPHSVKAAVSEVGPTLFSADPNEFTNALATSIGVRQWIGNDSAIVDVTYRSNLPFNGGNPDLLRTSSYLAQVEVPVLQKVLDPIFGEIWYERFRQYPRTVWWRDVRVSLTSNQTNAVLTAVEENAGKFYDFEGRLYLFKGANIVQKASGHLYVGYRFENEQTLRSIPIGTIGNDLAIPALPPFHDWRVDYSGTTPTSVVAVSRPNVFVNAFVGTLPGLP